MSKRKDYEILGRLIRDGAEIVLEPVGKYGLWGFPLDDEFNSILREELNPYGEKEAKILIAKLNVIDARKRLATFEKDLVTMKGIQKEPEAKTEEEGL